MKKYKIQNREIKILRIAGNIIMYKYIDTNNCEQCDIDIFEMITGEIIDEYFYESDDFINGNF
jgi:hypothetical protein